MPSPRRSPRRQSPDGLQIMFRIRDLTYVVEPLDPDPRVARKAYRLSKQGDDWAVYDVHVDEDGPHCECLGHLRWLTPCKHIRALQRAGMIGGPPAVQRAAG